MSHGLLLTTTVAIKKSPRLVGGGVRLANAPGFLVVKPHREPLAPEKPKLNEVLVPATLEDVRLSPSFYAVSAVKAIAQASPVVRDDR